MEQAVLDFYFKHIEDDDVVAKTCDAFGMREEDLNYLLDIHFCQGN